MVPVAKPNNSTPADRHPQPRPLLASQWAQSTLHPLWCSTLTQSPAGSQRGATDGTGWKKGEKRRGQGWLERSQGSGSPRTGKGRLGGASWAVVGPGEPVVRGNLALGRCWRVLQAAAILLPAGAASPSREERGRRWAE